MKRVAIIGKPNVGKSTLFNALTKSRKALVHPTPGVTRDRVSQDMGGWELVDTGGIFLGEKEELHQKVLHQTLYAMEQADLILWVVDGKEGLTTLDEALAKQLRRANKEVWLVINKMDTRKGQEQKFQFMGLGFETLFFISAEHHQLHGLREALEERMGRDTPPQKPFFSLAIVGKPNVGKSTLFNALVGEERVTVSEVPGTTRDSVDTLIQKPGFPPFLMVDTAGLKRRARTQDALGKLASVKAREAIRRSQLSILLVDMTTPITHQDKTIAGYIINANRGLMVVGNKMDLVKRESEAMRKTLENAFHFLPYGVFHLLSAKKGYGLKGFWKKVGKIREGFYKRVSTGMLNRVFQSWLARFPQRKRKFYYITQADVAPPTFVLFSNQEGPLDPIQAKFLIRNLSREVGFEGVPLVIKVKKR